MLDILFFIMVGFFSVIILTIIVFKIILWLVLPPYLLKKYRIKKIKTTNYYNKKTFVYIVQIRHPIIPFWNDLRSLSIPHFTELKTAKNWIKYDREKLKENWINRKNKQEIIYI